MYDLRIENGIVVTPEKSERTNIYVIDGKIAELSDSILFSEGILRIKEITNRQVFSSLLFLFDR